MEPLIRPSIAQTEPLIICIWKADREAMQRLLGPPVPAGASGLQGWPLARLDRYSLELLPDCRVVQPGQLPGWTVDAG